MNVDKSQILSEGQALGADDIAIVGADEADGNSIIVLFSRYYAAPKPQAGFMQLSPYYAASNRGYHAAKKLTAHLISLGAKAVHDTNIDAKAAALKSGGHIGENGFYYHSEFGSLVNLQTIVTDAVTPDEMKENDSACLNCGACFAACPSDAVDNVKNCLRYHSNSLVPRHLAGDLYQLFGCERCQTACPQNSAEQRETQQFRTDELIGGGHVSELKELAGSNMARANRISSQATLYAANAGQAKLITQLEELANTAPSPTREHALWAIERLKGGPHD